jgi:hypothetical protein
VVAFSVKCLAIFMVCDGSSVVTLTTRLLQDKTLLIADLKQQVGPHPQFSRHAPLYLLLIFPYPPLTRIVLQLEVLKRQVFVQQEGGGTAHKPSPQRRKSPPNSNHDAAANASSAAAGVAARECEGLPPSSPP